MRPYDLGLFTETAQGALHHFVGAGVGEQDQDIRRTDPLVHAALHFAEDLGFEYLSASNKIEFESACKRFTTSKQTEKPMLFECFVDSDDESTALNIIQNR